MYRAVQCADEHDFVRVDQASYPGRYLVARGLVKVGRCNKASMPVLYASSSALTAVAEINVPVGGYARLLAFSFAEHRPLGLVGELSYVHESGGSRSLHGAVEAVRREFEFKSENGLGNLLIDTFFSQALRKDKQDPAELASHYRLTSSISTVLLDPFIDGLMYPSVKKFGGWNLAIKPRIFDQRMRVLSASVVRVKRELGFGLIELETVMESTAFRPDRTIGWPR